MSDIILDSRNTSICDAKKIILMEFRFNGGGAE